MREKHKYQGGSSQPSEEKQIPKNGKILWVRSSVSEKGILGRLGNEEVGLEWLLQSKIVDQGHYTLEKAQSQEVD